MTNSERLTSHNALIDEAIAKAEALPDAGGGASVETCTVEIITGMKPTRVLYQQVLGEYTEWSPDMPGGVPPPFECMSGSLVLVNTTVDNIGSTNATRVYIHGNTYVFLITARSGQTATIG